MNDLFTTVARQFNEYLDDFNVAYTCKNFRDGYQWHFTHWPGDVILTGMSYFHDEGFVESYGFPWDEDDVSCCTPYEMARRLAGYTPNHNNYVERQASLADMLKSLCGMVDYAERGM